MSVVFAEKLSTACRQSTKQINIDHLGAQNVTNYHSSIDPFIVIVKQITAELGRQLTSVDALVQLV